MIRMPIFFCFRSAASNWEGYMHLKTVFNWGCSGTGSYCTPPSQRFPSGRGTGSRPRTHSRDNIFLLAWECAVTFVTWSQTVGSICIKQIALLQKPIHLHCQYVNYHSVFVLGCPYALWEISSHTESWLKIVIDLVVQFAIHQPSSLLCVLWSGHGSRTKLLPPYLDRQGKSESHHKTLGLHFYEAFIS